MKATQVAFLLFACLSIALLSVRLNLYGIEWGLPSSERLFMLFGSTQEMERTTPQLSHLVDMDAGERARLLTTPDIQKFTAHFDIIRSYHSDEIELFKAIANLDPARRDFNPKLFKYPSLHIYTSALALWWFARGGMVKLVSDLGFYLAHPQEFARFYLWTRFLTACFAMASVVLVFDMGSRLYSWAAGLIGAVILAVIPVWAIHAHFAKVDIPASFWGLVAMCFAVRFLEGGKRRWLYLAAAACGLAASTKYPLILALILVPAAQLARSEGNFWPRLGRAFLNRHSLIALLVCIGFFALSSPFVFLSYKKALTDIRVVLLPQYGRPGGVSFLWQQLRATKNYLGFVENLAITAGWGVFVLMAGGLLLALKRRTRADVLLLMFLGIYFLPIGLTAYSRINFLLPIVPVLALLGGRCAEWLTRRMSFLRGGKFIIYGLVILAISYSLLFTLAYGHLMTRTDVRVAASIWIEQNIPGGARIGMRKFPVIYRMPAFNHRRNPWVIVKEGSLDEPREEPPQWIILTTDDWDMPQALKAEIDSSYTLASEFQVAPEILGLKFVRFSATQHSGIGQIGPSIRIYKRGSEKIYKR
ncbi:MAG: hypothetical protein AMS15_09365 [Planctomycetes bacterium DG_23]|nr:MAG: hypothetical protein AMS15_09365 [Planctomycetes bacterium DG_23]